MVHLELLSQPCSLLLLDFFVRVHGAVYWRWWCLLGFFAVFWFVLLEADGMVPGTGMQSRLLGEGKARKVQTVGTKAKNGDELLSRGCGMVKILADKKLFLSSREISPMQWKPLPSTGTAEDEPCSATGVCDQTPQTVLTLAVFTEQIPQNMVLQEVQG